VAATPTSTPLSEVLISGQLLKRKERPILSTFTNAVVAELDRLLAEQPQDFMAEAARAAMILPGGHSGGISLGEGAACATRWVEGRWRRLPESVALFDRSVCPLALQQPGLSLLSRPRRLLPGLEALYPPIEEALLAPIVLKGRQAGLVWAVFHNSELQFDIHDGYMLQDLASMLAGAHGRLATMGYWQSDA
jgi:hypothetical protein